MLYGAEYNNTQAESKGNLSAVKLDTLRNLYRISKFNKMKNIKINII